MSTDLVSMRGMSTDLVKGMSTDLLRCMPTDLVPFLDVQTSPNVVLHFRLDPRCHGLKNYFSNVKMCQKKVNCCADDSPTKIMSSD